MSRVSGKPYFAYVLWSPSGKRFYIGISEESQKRLQQHNDGRGGWTARYRPWRLVHLEQYEDYRSAKQRELLLKKQKGGRGFFRLTVPKPASRSAPVLE